MDLIPRFIISLPFALLGQSVATYIATRMAGGNATDGMLAQFFWAWLAISALGALAGMAVASHYGLGEQSGARRWIMSLIAALLSSALILWVATSLLGG